MHEKTTESNIQAKIEHLKGVMKSFNAMSTVKQTAITLIQGQLSETLMVFLQSDEINDLLGSFKIVDDDPQDKREKMLIIDHALVIMNRCLGFQVEALITDQIAQLLVMTIMEDKQATFGVNKALQDLLWSKFRVMVEQASEAKTNSNESRFCSLHYIM